MRVETGQVKTLEHSSGLDLRVQIGKSLGWAELREVDVYTPGQMKTERGLIAFYPDGGFKWVVRPSAGLTDDDATGVKS